MRCIRHPPLVNHTSTGTEDEISRYICVDVTNQCSAEARFCDKLSCEINLIASDDLLRKLMTFG